MKPRILSTARLSFPLATAIAALLAMQSASAAGPYYWDNNGSTNLFGMAAGTWLSTGTVGSATQGWGTVSAGTTAPTGTITTGTGDSINFGTATASSLAAGTITVSGTVNAGNITFGSGAGAILLSGGTINLAAAETITVNNASDTISSILSGAATSLTKAGTGTLILSGSNTYTGNTLLNAGTITLNSAENANVSGPLGKQLASAVGTIVLGGGTLQYSAANQFDYSGRFSTAASQAYKVNTNSQSVTWATNLISSAGTLTKTGSGNLTLSGANSYSGGSTVTTGGLVFRNTGAKSATGTHAFAAGTTLGLGVATSGAFFTSADVDNAFSGTMTGNLSGITVTATTDVGIDTTAGDFSYGTSVAGSPTKGLTKLGANKLTLTGTNTYTGATTINEGTLALGVNHNLAGGLTFGSAATNTTPGILDLTSANATFGGALLVNTNSATANEIKIGAAQTLTINNNVQIGATTPVANGTVTSLNLTGGGTFNVTTAAAGTFSVGASTSLTASQAATLDLTALKATTINTSTTGTFRVGTNTTQNIGGQGQLLLPTPGVADTVATATITAGTISVGYNGSNVAATWKNKITLGTGLTTLNADTINVGTGGRDLGEVVYGQAGGDIIIRAAAGGINRATAINVGSAGGATASVGSPILMDFSAHDADILVTSLNVGNQARTGTTQGYEFNFGAGDNSLASKLDATNVNIGFRTGVATTTAVGTSKVNLSGGTVTFGNASATGTGVDIGNSTYDQAGAASTIGELNISGGNVTIHNSTSLGAAVRLGTNVAAGGGTVSASLNLTGGTTTLGGDIIRNATSPRTTSTVKIAGGTLDMGGKKIGTATELITLTAESGTLKNVASINGTGGLTKTTGGTLVIEGTNGYTGATNVTNGKLVVSGNISTSSLTTVDVGATLGGSGTVGKTIINGTLAVGNSPGTMTFTNTLGLNGITVMEIDGTAGAGVTNGHDFVNLTGAGAAGVLTYGGAMTLDIGVIFGVGSYSWNQFDMASETGTFATISLADQYSGSLLDDDLNGIWDLTSGDNTWQFTESTGVLGLTVIPEPNVAALLGGLGLLALLRRRRSS